MEILLELPFEERVRILTEGAKYDVSCSSSGSARPSEKGGIGNCAIGGICHTFTPDGRCVSLLKILQTNRCEYDCLYCINRRSNDIPRARLEPAELAGLVIEFYKRNYIEGLFLSSAVETSPNQTMQKLMETIFLLRTVHRFRGYIHVKAIPGADPALLEQAAAYADRMSVNIELPTEQSLKLLAPQKKKESLIKPMTHLAGIYLAAQEEKGRGKLIPAGQTTQMIIGATPDRDGQIIRLSEALYRKFKMKRVYYSAYVPMNDNSLLPAVPPDLRREHRLYEADWLLRFYGFQAEELVPEGLNLATDVDPKSDWALRHLEHFPLEINTASYEMLLRVPGIGVKNAFRITEARRHTKLTHESLKKLRVVLGRANHFIVANGKYLGAKQDPESIRAILRKEEQLKLNGGKFFEQLTFFERMPASLSGDL